MKLTLVWSNTVCFLWQVIDLVFGLFSGSVWDLSKDLLPRLLAFVCLIDACAFVGLEKGACGGRVLGWKDSSCYARGSQICHQEGVYSS